ncbi:hypothetical protein [Flavobacterium davisii]|uniref:hypothetical protein n=1 Tax=Flavobacterium davisii TaxID=2906077 RepID=UPI0021641F56|nr:hypothetical protein [Flavobacterium davisii]
MQQLSIGDEFIMKDGYLLTSDRSKLLLFINPKYGGSETEKNTQFVAQLKAIQSAINAGFKNKTTLSYFGSPVIAVANANQIKSDIITTVLLSMGTLMFILIFFLEKLPFPSLFLFLPFLESYLLWQVCTLFAKLFRLFH